MLWVPFLRRECAIHNLETVSPSSGIEGCAGKYHPSCVVVSKYVGTKRGAGKKFPVARALVHYIAHTGNEPAVLRKLRTPEQSRTRFFAAEFPAPNEWFPHEAGTKNDIERTRFVILRNSLVCPNLLFSGKCKITKLSEQHRASEVVSV